MTDKITIKLSSPSVFPDLNKKQQQDENYARDVIEIERMRYGHIKAMQTISPEKQTHWAIQTLTGLSENDLDQLYTEDAAEITKTIFGFIEKYFALAKTMWRDPVKEAS